MSKSNQQTVSKYTDLTTDEKRFVNNDEENAFLMFVYISYINTST